MNEPIMTPELRAFCDRVIVPALLERFHAERAAAHPMPAIDAPTVVNTSLHG